MSRPKRNAAVVQNIMEMFSTKCRSNYNPSPYLIIDE